MWYWFVFFEWGVEVIVVIDMIVFDINEVKKVISDVGVLIGVCEYCFCFGCFEV